MSVVPPLPRRPRSTRAVAAPAALALAGALLAACAPTAVPGPQQPIGIPATVQISGPSTVSQVNLIRNDRGDVTALPVRPDSAWAALAQAFDAVGLQPNTIVAPERKLGVVNGRIRRVLGRERLSRYLSCGVDVAGVPNAETYEVRLNVMSQILPDGEGSSLVTLVTADARPMTTSGDPVACGTTGLLEQRLSGEVKKRLGR